MRLWSLHPSMLDAKGLVALWREGLLARKVLRGATRGYRHHPQLARFRATRDPVATIDAYLSRVLDESVARGYSFDASKIRRRRSRTRMALTRGQLAFEWRHLRKKLERRDRARWGALRAAKPRPHPSFRLVAGGVEAFERVRPRAKKA